MNRIIKYILVGIGLILLGYLLWYLRSIVIYIIIAGFINLVARPLVDFLSRIHIGRWHLPRWSGAAISLFMFWLVLLVFFSIFIPIVASEANELSKIDVKSVVENLKVPIARLDAFLARFNLQPLQGFNIQAYLIEKIAPFMDVSRLSGFFGNLAGLFGNLFIAFFSISFISFFFMKEDGMFTNFIKLVTPGKYVDNILHIFESINHLLVRYFIGISLEVFFVMVLNAIGLILIGLEPSRAMLIALFAGILNVVPYIGPLIGELFGLLIGTATHLHYDFYSELLPLLGLIFMVMVTVQIIDNVVFQPVIYSSSVKAHPLEIFLVILIAAHLAGIIGMVLAIPTYTIIRVVAKEFFNNYKLVAKLTAKM